MQKEGLIKVNKGAIQILNSEAFCSPLSEHPIQTAQKSRRLPTCEMPEILKICSLPLFKHLSPVEVHRFLQLSHAKCVQLTAGDFLYREGNTDNKLYLLMEGSLFLQFEEQQAHPHLISQLGVGDLTGDTSFFSSQHHFDISCKAQTDCKIMVIRGEDFLSLFTGRYEEQETILNNLFAIVSRKISTLRDKVHLLSNPAARQRIVWYLFSLMVRNHTTHLIPPLNRETMAQYLGISRPALCKELRILESQNILRVHRNTFDILDTERMEPFRF